MSPTSPTSPMFEGIFPPLPTPFREDGGLDLGLLAALVESLNTTGLAGYLALGSNGEAVHLSAEEAVSVVRTVRESAAPGMRILAGTGQPSTRATIEATKRAADAGAEAALVLTPSYYPAATFADALRRHFESIADSSPVPIVLYNVPANTRFNCPVEIVAALASHPNIAGIKDSAGDAAQLAALVAGTRQAPSFEVLSGNFGTLLSGLATGAVGGILAVANVMPGECVTIFERHRAGLLAEAEALHARVLPVAKAVTTGWGVPGLKAAMELRGLPCGAPRGPLLPLDGPSRAELSSLLRSAGAIG